MVVLLETATPVDLSHGRPRAPSAGVESSDIVIQVTSTLFNLATAFTFELVRACVRACVSVHVCVCVRAHVCVCVRTYMCVRA